jgi:hypothetical protein
MQAAHSSGSHSTLTQNQVAKPSSQPRTTAQTLQWNSVPPCRRPHQSTEQPKPQQHERIHETPPTDRVHTCRLQHHACAWKGPAAAHMPRTAASACVPSELSHTTARAHTPTHPPTPTHTHPHTHTHTHTHTRLHATASDDAGNCLPLVHHSTHTHGTLCKVRMYKHSTSRF